MNHFQLIEVVTDCTRHGKSRQQVLSFIADKIGCPHCVAENQARQAYIEAQYIQRKMAKYAGIHPTHFDEWIAMDERMRKVKAFSKSYAQNPNCNFLLCGTTGTGKTKLAHAIGTQNLDKVLLIRSSDIHAKARATWGKSNQSEGGWVDYLSRIGLLIIDELGCDDDKKDAQDRLGVIIDKRQGKPTVITSNLAKDELKVHVGDRVWDRLQQNMVFAYCDWQSYRQLNRRYIEI